MIAVRRLTTAIALFLAATVASASAPAQRDYRFSVFLDDTKIGHHHFAIIRDGQRKLVRSEADFAVRILFVTAYSYAHSNEEHWVGSCLQRIRSTTDDNGERLAVTGELQGGTLRLARPGGNTTLDGCVRTFAYWDPQLLDTTRLLNAQTGEYIPVKVTDLGFEFMQGREARHVRIEGKMLAIDLWYSRDDEWLALESTTENGARLRYRLD